MIYYGQYGGYYPFYQGTLIQKGYGFGSAFRNFFKWAVPIFKKHALPTIESGAKAVGKQAVSSASEIIKDVIAGKNVFEAAKEQASVAVDSLKKSAEETLEGRGIKRPRKKNKFKKYPLFSKRPADIYDQDE